MRRCTDLRPPSCMDLQMRANTQGPVERACPAVPVLTEGEEPRAAAIFPSPVSSTWSLTRKTVAEFLKLPSVQAAVSSCWKSEEIDSRTLKDCWVAVTKVSVSWVYFTSRGDISQWSSMSLVSHVSYLGKEVGGEAPQATRMHQKGTLATASMEQSRKQTEGPKEAT